MLKYERLVKVILPLALPLELYYRVPESLFSNVSYGIRVEVPLRNKLYSGIVVEKFDELELEYRPKSIQSIIDDEPLITDQQYELWKWIAEYYVCSLGEVMSVALPTALKLSSETKLVINPDYVPDINNQTDKEYLVTEALMIQNELTIDEIRKILDQKTVYPIIRNLLDQNVLYIKEELIQKYKPKLVNFVSLNERYSTDPESLSDAMSLLSRSEKQSRAFLAFLTLSKKQKEIQSKSICDMAEVDMSVLKAMAKKGVFDIEKKAISRLKMADIEISDKSELTDHQITALQEIEALFEAGQNKVLLHGVTGSGKTRIYIELISKILQEGGQVLYLLPEIGLTTQIVQRLKKIFGSDIGVYHSRMSNNERVELWKEVYHGKKIVLGARSSLLLPFNNLKLIIVDEEHDPSYKQADPNPRYNARDISVFLSQKENIKLILGTATPSFESYYNVQNGRYGIVTMNERVGDSVLPDIEIIDISKASKLNKMHSHYSKEVLEAIGTMLEKKKQVLIFQNRRGFSPTMKCPTCGWHSECINCDVSLTLHKYFNDLRCHYCGYKTPIPETCPSCGKSELRLLGFGTEKIENELTEYFKDAKIERMDYDTVSSKHAHERLIGRFENREIDILVGTQMVTKGLDFENIGLVVIVNADMMLHFPDFRANERAYQLMTQVSGRAGRRGEQGKVMIQTYQAHHPIFSDVINSNYLSLYKRELAERRSFVYPPFFRFIQITLKHRKANIVKEAAIIFVELIKKDLGSRVNGPIEPGIARVRNLYIRNVLIKLEKKQAIIGQAKVIISKAKEKIQSAQGMKSVRINIDVDPY